MRTFAFAVALIVITSSPVWAQMAPAMPSAPVRPSQTPISPSSIPPGSSTPPAPVAPTSAAPSSPEQIAESVYERCRQSDVGAAVLCMGAWSARLCAQNAACHTAVRARVRSAYNL